MPVNVRALNVAVVMLAAVLSLAGFQARAPEGENNNGQDTYPGSSPAAVANAWDLPPLVLDDLDGRPHSLYDWHGRVIILNFWASWCGPCMTEIPHLVRYQTQYGAAGLQVIGVALDEARQSRNVARSLHISYPVLVADPQAGRDLLVQWGNPRQVLPYSVVIGRDGAILFTQIGIMDGESFTDHVLPALAPAAAQPPLALSGATGHAFPPGR